MLSTLIFLILALPTQTIQTEPFEQYFGCYEVIKYKASGNKPRFIPNRLKIQKNGGSLYWLPDGTKLKGTEFSFCNQQGTAGMCVLDTAYSTVGSTGISERNENYYLFSGDACSSPMLGRNCGGHIQQIDIREIAGFLEINMRQIMVEPISHEDYERGTEATVQKMDCKNFWK